MIKKTLLEIVQEILRDIKGDNVNSIADTEQATDIAYMVQSTYYDLITSRKIPELKEVIQLEGLADNTKPTFIRIPDNIKYVERFDYDISETNGEVNYRELIWCEPQDFLGFVKRNDSADTNVELMQTLNNANAYFFVRNDRHPTYYTSFDDGYLVCDAYKSLEETSLQGTKTRAYAVKLPVFSITDTFVPDIDEPHFRTLITEAKSTAFAIENRTINPKIEQKARKQRMLTQNDIYRAGQFRTKPNYGRPGRYSKSRGRRTSN